MRFKILIGILLVFLCISFVSAEDIDDLSKEDFKNIDFAVNDTIVEFDGFNFTIPAGFGPIDKLELNTTENDITTHCKLFANEKGEVIMFSTINGGDASLDLETYKPDSDTDKETINGHEGWEFDDEKYNYFTYIDGDTVILLQAPDDDYFEEMI